MSKSIQKIISGDTPATRDELIDILAGLVGRLDNYHALDARLSEFYTDDERALWWYRPHPQLMLPAIEMLLSSNADAAAQVERVIGQLDGQIAT